MAALPVILAVASTAASVYGSIQQANAQENSAKSQQYAEEYNQQSNLNKERAANQQWSAREDVLRRNRRMQLGDARAGIAQSGLTDTGSVLDMFDQSAVDSEFDILNQRYEGQVQAKGFGEAADQNAYGAKVAKSNAKAAKTAGWINAGSALLSGAASGYSSYKADQFQKTQTDVWKKQGLLKNG